MFESWPRLWGDGAPFLAAIAARSPIFPATGAEFLAATGVTLDSLYTFQEASGALDDKAGTSDLSPNGTPTFAAMVQGRQGINYDAAGDNHRGSVHDPALSSYLVFVVFANPNASVGLACGGYNVSTAGEGFLMYRHDGGVFHFDVRDSGANQRDLATTTTIQADRLYLASMQIDRTANTLRGRLTPRGGLSEAVSGDITGFATFSGGASHSFGFGSMPLSNGSSVFYGGVRKHASVEGPNVLRDLHRSLGWE